MRFDEQGTIDNTRYTLVPRTLSFVQCGGDLLLLRGAPSKRLWPNRLNGLGGHLERAEDPLSGALREIREEAALVPDRLSLRALIHVSGEDTHPSVLIFVYLGQVDTRETRPGDEGALEWHPVDALPWDEMVADLPQLLPRLLRLPPDGILYGVYETGEDGQMTYRWSTDKS